MGSFNDAPDDLPTDARPGYLLKRVQQELKHHMERRLRTLNLSVPQYAALAMLEQHPGLSNAALAERCFVTPQTLQQIVVRLEQRGFASRKPHPEHGRILQTELTGAGAELLGQAHTQVLEVEQQLVSSLAGGEREQLTRLLEVCLGALRTPGPPWSR